ncbi:GFA family protein [Sphingomonas montanisoli]|uniref:GFA family protein n=2 Tax=Sphingomonas montanisoli TaxID=2606412 RepID=A0A5D9C6A0_9SPHN|nr:GFA family protein [Sphingomonas montanisoli]
MAARTCWCRLCQYLGGGTATANICFPSDKVTRTGELTFHDSVADSGNTIRRGFCPTCGTPATSEALSRPHLIFLRIGTLDDPDLMGPQATIWTEAAPEWACISSEIPNYPAQVPPVA